MKGKTTRVSTMEAGLAEVSLYPARARQIAANTIHGRETRAIREERSAKLAELYEIEKEMRSMGMVEGSWVSRKPPSR